MLNSSIVSYRNSPTRAHQNILSFIHFCHAPLGVHISTNITFSSPEHVHHCSIFSHASPTLGCHASPTLGCHMAPTTNCFTYLLTYLVASNDATTDPLPGNGVQFQLQLVNLHLSGPHYSLKVGIQLLLPLLMNLMYIYTHTFIDVAADWLD